MEFQSDATSSDAEPSSGKRRYHSVSPFYLFCKEHVEEMARKGRHFRTTKQGFEAASLKWNTLSPEEKNQWREKFRAERKKCAEEGSQSKLKVRNGDRGDPNNDPTDLALLKDFDLKRDKDVNALISRWQWLYSDQKEIGKEQFLLITAKCGTGDHKAAYWSLAVIDFSLAAGIIDEYQFEYDRHFSGNLTNARYAAIRRVLEWPSKINRRLGDNAPNFFAPRDGLAVIFDALTYMGGKTTTRSNWSKYNNQKENSGSNSSDPLSQFSLVKDLSSICDLEKALRMWFKKARSATEENTDQSDSDEDCLSTARKLAGRLLNEFATLLDK